MTARTDADVRAELREAAYLGARTLKLFVKPILDPRDFEGEEVPDAEDRHRMQQAAQVAIGAWAKTVEVPKDAPQDLTDAEKREQTKRLLRERPAALLELAREAGVEIRALAIAGALTVGSQETDDQT